MRNILRLFFFPTLNLQESKSKKKKLNSYLRIERIRNNFFVLWSRKFIVITTEHNCQPLALHPVHIHHLSHYVVRSNIYDPH